ncbi:MAG: hypothetical protein ACJ8EL_13950 [Rhizomicrobium sp.]
MPDRIFGDRERAMEESYFRHEDAKLIDKLRQNAHLDEIALALGEKLQIEKPDLLLRVREAGVSLDTAPALFLAPLLQVAWAGGSVTMAEHDAVLRLARARGIDPASPAYAQLEEWLKERPDDALFDTAVEVIKEGFSVLPQDEREERIKKLVDACQQVASASTKGLGWVLGLKSVSYSEASTLDAITNTLRRPERLKPQ